MIEPLHPLVVVVPGLWMPAWMLSGLQRRLARLGHRCVQFRYPSVRGTLDENSARLAGFVRSLGTSEVFLVGHSLGGLIALQAVASGGLGNVRRIALLGSPYRGCRAAEGLAACAAGRRMLGRTMADWLARPRPSLPPGVEVGVLAGTLPVGLARLVTRNLVKPHDGVICADETPIPGMHAFVEVRVNHFGMVLSERVAQLADRFLTAGTFAADRPLDAPLGRARYAVGARRES